MSGPQFVHIETYARSVSSLRREREATRAEEGKVIDRKLSVEEICGEAARLPGHHPHIQEAIAPVLLHGVSPDLVPALLEERIAAANAAIRAEKAALPRGARQSGPRAIRSDTHTILAMVASHPLPLNDPVSGRFVFADPDNAALVEKWQELNIRWAKRIADVLGFDLVSVVRHDDEAHPHLHFIGIPRGWRVEARGAHPGYVARDALKREVGEDDRSFKRRQNAAYNDAMRAFQDDYYESVSIDAGLLRVGPKRLRLPNARYKEEKTIARARGAASVRVEELAREKSQKEADLAETNEVLASATKDAIEAIKRIGTAGAEHYQLEKAIGEKAGRVASMDAEIDYQQKILKEMQAEISALEDAKRQRMEIEEELALKRTQSDAEAETLKRREEILERDRKELLEKVTEERNKLELQERALSAERRHIDAIEEGIVAFCEGRLRLSRSDDDKLILHPGTEVADQEMIGRLAPVKPRLIPILRTLDGAMTKRTLQLGQAISAAISGWAAGLLEGLGEPSQNGRPTFQVEKTSAGDRLLKVINPFRDEVARVISILPNYSVIASIKSAVARLRPRLLAVDQEEALRLEAAIQQLQAARSADRD